MPDTRPPAGDWSPSYPEFAEPGKNPLREIDPSGKPWEPAPATSHVWGWRLYDLLDPKEGPFIKKFLSGRSELHVRFKPSGKKGITEYAYYFTDGLRARKFLDDFRTNPHPGHVVQLLIDAGIPYTRVV